MAQILPIRLFGDPILKKKAQKIEDFSDVIPLAEDMFETLFEAKGVGLAAPQVGVSKRIFVAVEYEIEEEEEGEDAPARMHIKNQYVIVNPSFSFTAGEQSITEGCLSIPGVYSEGAKRFFQVKMDYQNEHGEHKSLEVEDYLAVVMQHELDHLEGTMFYQRMPFNLKQSFLEENREDLADFQREAKAYLKSLEAGRK
jgi:peptide deformylase